MPPAKEAKDYTQQWDVSRSQVLPAEHWVTSQRRLIDEDRLNAHAVIRWFTSSNAEFGDPVPVPDCSSYQAFAGNRHCLRFAFLFS